MSLTFFFPDSDDDIFIEQELSTLQPVGPSGTLLGNFSADTLWTYKEDNGPSGIYSVVLKAEGNDSSVRLYASTSPESDQTFPHLPTDATVRVMDSTDSTVTVAWKSSPTENLDADVEYCVAVSKERNFVSECDASTYIYGETVPTPPPYAGFGFSWEKEKEAQFQRDANPRLPASPGIAYYTCINSKTVYTFVNAEPDQLYFFDVFVVNRRTNASSAYHGTSGMTDSKGPVITLKDGKVYTGVIKSPFWQKVYQYTLKWPVRELVIAIAPCLQDLTVNVLAGKEVIRSAEVTKFTYLNVFDAKPGQYSIQIRQNKSRTGSFRMSVTSDPQKNPFPLIPNRQQIEVNSSQKTCKSLTISWHGTSQRQQYCLYMQKHVKPTSRSRYKDGSDSNCIRHHSRKKSDKVLCRSFRSKSHQKSLLTETVSRLSPNSSYTFDVYVSKPGGQTLWLSSVQASTLTSCKH